MNEKYEYKKRFYDLEQEENWLNEMSEKGLALKEIKRGTFKDIYLFEPCGKKYIYREDYNVDGDLDAITSPYIKFVTETYGCECVCISTKIYFRKPAESGDFPPIYTDSESRIGAEKKQFHLRLVNVLTFVILLNISVLNCVNAFRSDSMLSVWGFVISAAAIPFGGFCVVYFALTARRHYKKIKELENRRNGKGGGDNV